MYRLPSEFRRTPDERRDQTLSWERSDQAFFAAGACHILARAFLDRYPGCGFWLAGIRERPADVVCHMVATNGESVFDFNGMTPYTAFRDAIEADFRTRLPDWCLNLYRLDGDFRGVCEREHHRHPEDFAFLPWDRAERYLDSILRI